MCKAKFEGLFMQYHLLDAAILAAGHLVEIDTGSQGITRVITAIPKEVVISSRSVVLLKAAHDLPFGVVDIYLHSAGTFKLITDSGMGVEGIGISIIQLGSGGNSRAACVSIDAEDYADGTMVAACAIHFHILQPVVIGAVFHQTLIHVDIGLRLGSVGGGDHSTDLACSAQVIFSTTQYVIPHEVGLSL